MSPTALRRSYPRKLKVGRRTFEVTRIDADSRDAMLAFGRGLSEEDQLFLRFDITREEVVDEIVVMQEDDRRVTLLAWDEGEVKGYASLSREPLSWTRHLGEIRVIVARDARGTGLGSALAREIHTVAQEFELRKVIARMPLRQEGARKLFERLGFSAEALLADWVMDKDGKTHDLVVMGHDATSLTD